MKEYKKVIEITSTGMVFGFVYNENDRRVGFESWSSFINTNNAVDRNCKKAHKWADKRISICVAQEVGVRDEV